MMFAFVHRMGTGDACGCTQAFDCLALSRSVILGVVQSEIGDVIRRCLSDQLGVREPRMTLLPKSALIVRDAEFAVDDRGQIAVLASNLPTPIVRARFGAIPKDAIAEFWNIRYARGEIAVFVMAP